MQQNNRNRWMRIVTYLILVAAMLSLFSMNCLLYTSDAADE